MDDAILITELNDFIFCPASIYFHKLYGCIDKISYQSIEQLNGTAAHEAVDEGKYSDKKTILMGMDIYCEKYNLIGKIDIVNLEKHAIRERKKQIKQIYDGYIFQVYAQYFALKEMGYDINSIELYSMDDHKTYCVKLPEEDSEMFHKFEKTIADIRSFKMDSFMQNNVLKCQRCIYEPACDKSLL